MYKPDCHWKRSELWENHFLKYLKVKQTQTMKTKQ